LVGGLAGALLAAIGVFLPCWVIVLVAAPHYRRLASQAWVKAFVAGVTAGAVGAIAGAALVLARRSIVDAPTALIAVGALAAVVLLKKLPEPWVILSAGALGIAVHRWAS
jgi:chromate transporter